MDSTNPYGEALDKDRHVDPEEPVTEHTVTEADVVHLKVSGGSLACGTPPHGVTATLSEAQDTCALCLKEISNLREKIST